MEVYVSAYFKGEGGQELVLQPMHMQRSQSHAERDGISQNAFQIKKHTSQNVEIQCRRFSRIFFHRMARS